MAYEPTVAYAARTEEPVSGAPPEPEPEALAGAGGPLPSHPTGDGLVVCASCGQVNAAGSDQCARPSCRRTLAGNALSRRTGLYAAPTSPELRAIDEAGRALFVQSVLDAGGREELIARVFAEHEYRGVLHSNIRKLALALQTRGLFDQRGRLRVGWITKLESLISTAVSIDRTLGLARRSRPVPSARDIIAEYDRRERETQS